LEYFLLDLNDYESGLELVQKVYAEVPELDIILCNAGTNFFDYETSKSGHERLMQGTYTPLLLILVWGKP
jgi:short-subunit dehydrogenase involved in D-alanine esterification of teichoic acids